MVAQDIGGGAYPPKLATTAMKKTYQIFVICSMAELPKIRR
jgi:hypothetical protein